MTKTTESNREMLRHAVATLAYRGAKAVHNPPANFSNFQGGGRTPAKILAHIGDLLDWALSVAVGAEKWHDSEPLAWDREATRFFSALKRLDEYLASDKPVQASAEQLFQGPIADALTHVGQLAMLRRMAGGPITGENYFVADIATGRVGADQAPPKGTF